jgi:transaldolase
VGAKRLWHANQKFWSTRPTPLRQEIIFASTGTKKPDDPPWKYVAALAGSDIQTNPPATNEAVEKSGLKFQRTVDQMPPASVLEEIDNNVDVQKMEEGLMREGVAKFAEPQKDLLKLLADRRRSI